MIEEYNPSESELRGKIVHLDYAVDKLNMDIIHGNQSPDKLEQIKIDKQQLQGATDTMLMMLLEGGLSDTNLIDMGSKSILIFPHPSGGFNHRQNIPAVGPEEVEI